MVSKTPMTETLGSEIYYSIFKECWSIIDFGWKLRNLILQIEHEKTDENTKINKDLLLDISFLDSLKDYRNTFQHLDERIDEAIVVENSAVWGCLSWLYILSNTKLNSCLLFPGHPRSSSSIINPAGLMLESPICHVTLESINRKKEKIKINLSDLAKNISILVNQLESLLKSQFEELDNTNKYAQDMIMKIEIEFKIN